LLKFEEKKLPSFCCKSFGLGGFFFPQPFHLFSIGRQFGLLGLAEAGSTFFAVLSNLSSNLFAGNLLLFLKKQFNFLTSISKAHLRKSFS
jgi:hypothetical protein